MKISGLSISCLVVLPLLSVSSSYAQLAPSQNKEHLKTVTDAYSQCAAYYEVVGNSLKKSGRTDLAENAMSMKSQSNNLALIMAQDLVALSEKDAAKIDTEAKALTQENYVKALRQLEMTARKGKGEIARVSAQYQKGCHSALNEPGVFSENVLSTIVHKKELDANKEAVKK